MNKLAERLKDLREEKGLSQQELRRALKLGGGSTVSRWESGKQDIASHHLILLADFFDVSIDYLVGRVDD